MSADASQTEARRVDHVIHRVNGRVRWVEMGTTHYVADKDFYGYILDRTAPPRMVCIFNTEREMRSALLDVGITL